MPRSVETILDLLKRVGSRHCVRTQRVDDRVHPRTRDPFEHLPLQVPDRQFADIDRQPGIFGQEQQSTAVFPPPTTHQQMVVQDALVVEADEDVLPVTDDLNDRVFYRVGAAICERITNGCDSEGYSSE